MLEIPGFVAQRRCSTRGSCVMQIQAQAKQYRRRPTLNNRWMNWQTPVDRLLLKLSRFIDPAKLKKKNELIFEMFYDLCIYFDFDSLAQFLKKFLHYQRNYQSQNFLLGNPLFKFTEVSYGILAVILQWNMEWNFKRFSTDILWFKVTALTGKDPIKLFLCLTILILFILRKGQWRTWWLI